MNILKILALFALAAALSGCEFAGAAAAVGIDLDCSDFDAPVWVGDDDPHHLDGDGDGWGCESLG